MRLQLPIRKFGASQITIDRPPYIDSIRSNRAVSELRNDLHTNRFPNALFLCPLVFQPAIIPAIEFRVLCEMVERLGRPIEAGGYIMAAVIANSSLHSARLPLRGSRTDRRASQGQRTGHASRSRTRVDFVCIAVTRDRLKTLAGSAHRAGRQTSRPDDRLGRPTVPNVQREPLPPLLRRFPTRTAGPGSAEITPAAAGEPPAGPCSSLRRALRGNRAIGMSDRLRIFVGRAMRGIRQPTHSRCRGPITGTTRLIASAAAAIAGKAGTGPAHACICEAPVGRIVPRVEFTFQALCAANSWKPATSQPDGKYPPLLAFRQLHHKPPPRSERTNKEHYDASQGWPTISHGPASPTRGGQLLSRDWCGWRDSNPHGSCDPTDFRTRHGLRRRPLRWGVWGLDYPFTMPAPPNGAPGTGAARLVSTPSGGRAAGLARDCRGALAPAGFPEFEQFYAAGFPAGTQSISPMRLPFRHTRTPAALGRPRRPAKCEKRRRASRAVHAGCAIGGADARSRPPSRSARSVQAPARR